jgi:CubicO group peptidase (beta-lactamase class C family)
VQEHIAERFHRPLGMERTSWVEPTAQRWARPYRWEDGASVPDLPHPIGDGEISPMGGIWTTVADLCRWISWLDDAHRNPAQADPLGLSTASRREMQRIQTYIGARTLADVSAPCGYGFGLVVRDDPTLGITADHSGGLPGYGSNMRWVAGTGVGAIALANTTYAPMSSLTMRLLYAFDELGGMPSPATAVSPALASAAEALVALLNDWQHDRAGALFADNVVLDESFERRAAAAQTLLATHGPLRIREVRPTSWANGDVLVEGTGDPFRITVELSPLLPARLQLYSLPD